MVTPGRRKRPPPPCPCQCEQLAARLAEFEDLAAALVRATVALRPRAASHSVAQGLTGWGVDQADAVRLEAAWHTART
jgi:hypothetical protein